MPSNLDNRFFKESMSGIDNLAQPFTSYIYPCQKSYKLFILK